MTVIRVHELAKKMKVESKEILAVLERMGIKGKTATSGLDDKETKSLIDKLKAIRKDKERTKKDGGVAVSREERQKKAAALIGKFSSTLERPGAKPKSVVGAPPVIPPPGAAKKEPAMPKEPVRAAAAATGVKEAAQTERAAPTAPRKGRPAKAEPFNALPGLAPTSPMPAPPAGRPTRKKWQKKHAERERMQEREFREKPSFKKLPDLKTLPSTKKPHRKEEKHGMQTDVAEITKPRQKAVKFQEGSTVKEFAELMGQKVGDVIKKLMGLGMLATQNQAMDMDAATLLAEQYGMKVEVATLETAEDGLQEKEDEAASLHARPPMVTIMGHVDHGKTSLLDAIRETNVVAKEAGGITQHIGAYQVSLKGKEITFLDTPGHEAFTAMRARGAQVTDIVVLVVAADDGVMPQTREAVNHAKAAGVPIIVAVNKIDKPDAKPDRVKQELTELELVPEEWGGDTIFCEVSAKQHTGIEHLLEMILIQSDVLELKANPDKLARGTIIEAKLDRGRGPVATVLVQGGTLKVGDIFVSGVQFGRVRALINDLGERIESAAPSVPAEVIGFSGVPKAGDGFIVVEEERKARQVAEFRMNKQRTAEMAAMKKVTLEDLHSQIQEGMVKELNIVLKADVQGSVGAIVDALTKLSTQEVKLRVIHSSVGAITETDVMLATASNAIIIGFSVRPEPKASEIAAREGVDIRLYNIIYNAVDDIKAAMEGLLEPTLKERALGRAEVRQTFHVSKVGTIAGCYVQDGIITRQSDGVRVLRDNVVVYEGKLHSLKRFKDDVREVQSGYECGIAVENFNDIKVGDIIEAYTIDKVAAKL